MHNDIFGPSVSGVSSVRNIVKSDIMANKKPVTKSDFIVRLTASTALFNSINVVSFFLLRTIRKALLKSFIRPVEIRNGMHIISKIISVGKSIKYRNTEDCPHNPVLHKTMVRITAMNEIKYIKISSFFICACRYNNTIQLKYPKCYTTLGSILVVVLLNLPDEFVYTN